MENRPTGWVPALLTALLAAAAGMAVQGLIRSVWQIRTLPERVMEWLLLFIPLDAFESGVQQFGPNAKDLALYGAYAGMSVAFFVIGVLALRSRRLPPWGLLVVGLLLWLVTMAVMMPVTGAGLFATQLLQAPLLVNAGFLAVYLAYASGLVVGRLLAGSSARPTTAVSRVGAQANPGRRALVAGVAGTLAAYALAAWTGRNGGLAGSDLPLAVAPPAAPAAAASSAPVANAGAWSASPVAQAPVATPTAGLPVPPPARDLPRDTDGALVAASRPKGTLAPQITDNEAFYVVTKNAAGDPVVDPNTWRLMIDGQVNHPVQVDYATLRALPSVEVTKTLECISNFTARCDLTSFGCDLMSTARWKGVKVTDLLDLAGGLKPGVQGFAIMSVDEFSAGLPVDAMMDPNTLLVYEMNGDVLPREHGYPARLLVPGRYGMKNPKWVAAITPMSQEYLGWYEQRGWNHEGIVKTMGRIDTPAAGASLRPGAQQIAGVAYGADRGIQSVELSADNGATWNATTFLEQPQGMDQFVRWQGSFDLGAGTMATLVVRATDGTGTVQSDAFALPQPDGGSGRDSIDVQASA